MADFLNYGEKRSLLEFDSIFKSQWLNGFLPHIRYTQEEGYYPNANMWAANHNGLNTSAHYKTSSITQPPLAGYMFELCFKRAKNKASFLAELKKYIPQLHSYHKYLFENRNYENCIYVIHPWESGLDNSPVFDSAGENAKNILIKKGYKNLLTERLDTQNVNAKERPSNKDYELYGLLMDHINKAHSTQAELLPFAFIDVIFNSIYAKSLSSLLFILNMYKKYQIEIDDFNALSSETDNFLSLVLEGMISNLYSYSDNCFYCFDIVSQKSIRMKTIHNFFPLILKEHLPSKKTNELIKNFQSYSDNNSFFQIPTNMDEKNFNPYNYWRGPIWPIINWFFIEAFDNQQYYALYLSLKEQTIRLINEDFGHPKDIITKLAFGLMEFNSYDSYFTTPSRQQYHHGWLWDSCFAALGWVHAEKANRTFYDTWEKIYSKRRLLKSKGYNEQKVKNAIRKDYSLPMFSEYYTPIDYEEYCKRSPLGSDMMTWTASVYLDITHKDEK